MSLSISTALLLQKFGDQRVQIEEEKAGAILEMHPYAFGKRYKGSFNDVSPKLFAFGNVNSFSAVWANVRKTVPALSSLTHTRFRYYIETTVIF